MNDTRAVRLLIAGDVQGVGFRAFVAREARHRAIGGFARNLRDGRVEVVAQGDPDAIAALCDACGRGPYGSRVARVDIAEVLDAADFRDFAIAGDG